MTDKHPNDAPDEFIADLLARQVPVMQQQIMSLQIEVAHRDKLIADLLAERVGASDGSE